MASLTIGGRTVDVDDGFLSLPPDQQNAVAQEIAASMGGTALEGGRLNSVRVNWPGVGAVAEDVAKSGAIGLVKGAIGTASAPGDLMALSGAATDFVVDKLAGPGAAAGMRQARSEVLPTKERVGDLAKFIGIPVDHLASAVDALPQVVKDRASSLNPLRTSTQVQKDVEQVTGPFYKPQTVAGEYAQTVGEFAPAAIGGPAGVVRKAAQVVVPAVVSETAGQATKGTEFEPYARFGGALIGGAAASAASRPGTASRSIRENLPEGVTPQMVDQAEALMQDAARQGIQLAWPEALSQVAGRPILTDMLRHLEASPQTQARMGEFFAGRPQQVEAAAERQFNTIAPANPNPSTIGSQANQAAQAEVTMTRQAINQAAEPYYRQAENVLLTPQEMDLIRQRVPGFDEARQAVRNDPQLNRYVAHLPDESVIFLNEVKKYLDTAAENAAGPFNQQRNQQRAAGYGTDARNVRGAARFVDDTYGGGNYRQALEIEERGRQQILQPLLDGYIGKLARNDLTTQQAINALFPQKALANSEGEIARAVSALERQRPRVASDLVRAYVEQTFNTTARDLQTGVNQAGGAKFRAALVGDRQQQANLEAAVRSLPNGDQRWNGFQRFLDVLEATGTRPNVGSRTEYNRQRNQMEGAGGLIADTIKTGANPARLGQKYIDKYEQWKLGRNLGELARILTSPGSANQLRAIARVNPESSGAISLAVKLITYGEAAK